MSPRLWPWVPALLLGSLLGTQLVVLSRVLDDPSFAVENDYYQKALHWDAERTRVERSHALGWTATGEAHAASGGQALLVIALRDGHGAALSGAELELLAFHNARAAAPLSLHAKEVRPGEYQTELDHPRPGRWEVRVHALRGKETYDEVLRLDVAPTGPRT
jgi:nitrogen fixation protein FixH